jgi:cell division protein FtsN
VTVQIEVLEKPSVPTVARSKPSTPRYPYSVYLGSFKAADAVRKAISDYQVKGLSAYWVKVDLGDKGVWYRFFTGYFRTKEEAEKYINERNLQGATPGITKFANFIDSYGSDKEAEDRKQAIVSAGFYPYVIKDAEGRFLLYSGAFDRKEYADKERTDLAAKGIKSEAVER